MHKKHQPLLSSPRQETLQKALAVTYYLLRQIYCLKQNICLYNHVHVCMQNLSILCVIYAVEAEITETKMVGFWPCSTQSCPVMYM